MLEEIVPVANTGQICSYLLVLVSEAIFSAS